MTSRPAIIGLDLSLAATGIARADGTFDTIRPDSNDDHRLVEITNDITIETSSLTGGEPGLVVIEDLPIGFRNAAAGPLGMIHGAIRLTLQRHQIRYLLVPPASLKTYATGRGNAPKPELRMELYKRTGIDISDDNQVDAAWLRLLGLDFYSCPEIQLPQSHRRALDKITSPKGTTP